MARADHRRSGTVARRRALYEEAVAILAWEYQDPPALAELARRLATSPRQLQRAFVEEAQSSVRTQLCELRMRRAATLLQEGMAVREAASAVGYRQAAQFTKAFHRQYGILPSSLRVEQARVSRIGSGGGRSPAASR